MLGVTMIGMHLIGWSITISPMGLTMHGIAPGPTAKKIMPNTLDKNARFAYNPQFHLTAKTEHWQFGAGYLKDCFDMPAGTAYIGPKVDIFKGYVSLGAVFGAYARKQSTKTVTVDGIKFGASRLPFSAKVKGIEVMPMAAATISVQVPVTKRISIETNVAASVYINHAMIGLKWKFN